MTMQVGGMASSAVGSYYSAASQKAGLQLGAGLADISAKMSEAAAQEALVAGAREVQKSEIATSQLKGTQRASIAANGVDLSSGSAVNVLTTTDYMGEVDRNTIEGNAIKQAMGIRTQGVNYGIQAMTGRASANAINPTMSATTSLIGGAGNVAAGWYQYSKAAG